MTFDINIDIEQYSVKPTSDDMQNAITPRLQKSKPVTCTIDDLVNAVEHGQTYTRAALVGGARDENWTSQQLFILDVDNEVETPIKPDTFRRALSTQGLPPALMYHSFSSTDEHPRYRIVFVCGQQITTSEIASRVNVGLENMIKLDPAWGGDFGKAIDYKTKALSNKFYGSRPGCIIYKSEDVVPLDKLVGIAWKYGNEAQVSKGVPADGRPHTEGTGVSEGDTWTYNRRAYRVGDFVEALKSIPPFEHGQYDDWLKVTTSYKLACEKVGVDVTDIKTEAYQAWAEWTSASSEYSKGDLDKWRQANTGKGRVSVGTLLHYAQDNGYILPPKLDDEGNPLPAKHPLLTIPLLQTYLDESETAVRYNVLAHTVDITQAGEDVRYNEFEAILHSDLRGLFTGADFRTLSRYLYAIARTHEYNPVRELFAGLTWDNVDRWGDLFELMGIASEDDKLSQTYIRKWFYQAYIVGTSRKRIPTEGVLVLQGVQGSAKSSLVRFMGLNDERFYFEGKKGLDPDRVDSVREYTCAWITEIGEFESTTKSEVEALKAFVTADSDTYRLPYATVAETYQRHTVFVATCNSTGFLRDDTGNRRYWIVNIPQKMRHSDIATFDFRQLWAQAKVEANTLGEGAFRFTEEEYEATEAHNLLHMASRPYQDEIESAIRELSSKPTCRTCYVTASDWLAWELSTTRATSNCLNRLTADLVSKVLHNLGYESTRKRIGGSARQARVYALPCVSFAMTSDKTREYTPAS